MERSPSDVGSRPTRLLPTSHVVQLSLYWLGLVGVFQGINIILQERVDDLVPADVVGSALGAMQLLGVVIAVLVQPTVGSISDYTTSRWGRRKPYIVIGSVLDVVFLLGIATSQTYLSVAAFLVLLQLSSNFAQGPFQGYVPDLVPAPQVGLASALVGMMSVLGVMAGTIVAAWGTAVGDFFWPTMTLGLIELLTMLALFVRIDEGRAARDRAGRSWREVALEAWGTDVLRERSFLFLVGSRFFILGGSSLVVNLAARYMERSHGLASDERATWYVLMVGLGALATVLATIPAGRLSDRVGRKRVIYAACAFVVAGLVVVAVAPAMPLALPGAALLGIGTGSFLAVDWALMTDIIPKASSGRYMGLSNVATATNGVVATFAGGLIVDALFRAGSPDVGPRLAIASGVAWLALGAALLRPVDERRREDRMAPEGSAEGVVAAAS